METTRPVIVRHLPERLNLKQARQFLRELEPALQLDRPQLVFDMSGVRQLDAAGVDMLLHSMSRAMKKDGDVKLAALSPQAATILELTRTERLFEIYATATDAVRSYTSYLPGAMRQPAAATWPALGATTPALVAQPPAPIAPAADSELAA